MVVLAVVSLRRLSARMTKQSMLFPMVIEYDGKQIKLKALLDTGNQLYTIGGNRPVVLVEQQTIEPIVGEMVAAFLRSLPPDDWLVNLEQCLDQRWLTRVSIIPYKGVGGKNMLLGFRSDRLTVLTANHGIVADAVVIGIVSGSLSSGGEYQGLLHPSLLNISPHASCQEKF